MVENQVVFYIGAHWHTYERIKPYLIGGNFTTDDQPYKINKNTQSLISVVEGISGNDKSIV